MPDVPLALRRSRRQIKPPPLTYWEEFVATDKWYVKELTADVPANEWEAAILDSDWSQDSDEEEDDDGSSSGDEGHGSVSVDGTSDASDDDASTDGTYEPSESDGTDGDEAGGSATDSDSATETSYCGTSEEER